MKPIKAFLLASGITLAGQVSASSSLNISASPQWVTSGTCSVTSRGGLLPPNYGAPPCVVDFPIELSSDQSIGQVTVYYGANGSGAINIKAELRYKELKSMSGATTVDHATPFSWSSTASGNSTTSGYAHGLMSDPPLPDSDFYPDEFLIGDQKSYYVRVTLARGGAFGLGSKPELFGVNIKYY